MKYQLHFVVLFSIFSLAYGEDYSLGGDKVKTDKYPFVAHLDMKGKGGTCSGSLVKNGEYILTAKHCTG